MKNIIPYLSILLLLVLSCSKPETGSYTKTQIDSAINYKLDSFSRIQKRLLDSLAYADGLALAQEMLQNDSFRTLHKDLQHNIANPPIDTNKNAIPYSILDEQFGKQEKGMDSN
jgi:hypothetical protein